MPGKEVQSLGLCDRVISIPLLSRSKKSFLIRLIQRQIILEFIDQVRIG
ncbi:MAG: hypothetical protein ACE5FZ_06150 [Nitrospiria bacterium]